MGKFKWDRHNNGYELEPWRKTQSQKNKRPSGRSSKEIIESLGKHSKHELMKKIAYHEGYKKHLIWCVDCNHHVQFISESDYNTVQIQKNEKRVLQTLLKQDKMPFGKYKGKMISQLPDDYLKWAILNLDQLISNQLIVELQRRYPEYK